MKRKGAKVVIDAILNEGIDVVFGVPGGAVLDIYDELYDSELRHILMKHEQCAAHAADGYARVSGKTGVIFATSGPGATNIITGLVNAQMDSVPIVAITGQVPTHQIGKDAFQEADTYGLSIPITKHSYQVRNVDILPETIKSAFTIANTGRKGVVLIDLPKDIQNKITKKKYPNKVTFKGYEPDIAPKKDLINICVDILKSAERPVILAGGGIITSNAEKELKILSDMLGAPVCTTLMGKGAFPEDDPLSLGMAGHHGKYSANFSIRESDVFIAIGTRFSDRTTGWKLADFAPNAVKIHLDIDNAEVNKNIEMDLAIIGDAKNTLESIIELLKKDEKKQNQRWITKATEMHAACMNCTKYFNESFPLKPERVIKELNDILDDDAIVTTEVGQTQMCAAHYYITKKPRTFISSGGLGTMGFGFPAAIGAQVAAPDKTVVDIAGDGSFLMTSQDLATAVAYDIPVIVVIFNNSYLGMVRQWQEFFYDGRYSETSLEEHLPDFVKYAESFGAYGEEISKPGELKEAFKNAKDSGKPAVINVKIEKSSNIFPMISPGGGLSDMTGLQDCLASKSGIKKMWSESKWRRI